MTAEKNFLRRLADSDVDDLMDHAGKLPRAEREARLRETLDLMANLRNPLVRTKALYWIQASLAGFDLDDLVLPVPLAIDLVARLAQTVRSKSVPVEARQSALTAIALVFVKVRELPRSLDIAIRRAFRSAAKDSDEQLRGYANRSLAAAGVLSRRCPKEAPVTPGLIRFTFKHSDAATTALESYKDIADRSTAGPVTARKRNGRVGAQRKQR